MLVGIAKIQWEDSSYYSELWDLDLARKKEQREGIVAIKEMDHLFLCSRGVSHECKSQV